MGYLLASEDTVEGGAFTGEVSTLQRESERKGSFHSKADCQEREDPKRHGRSLLPSRRRHTFINPVAVRHARIEQYRNTLDYSW